MGVGRQAVSGGGGCAVRRGIPGGLVRVVGGILRGSRVRGNGGLVRGGRVLRGGRLGGDLRGHGGDRRFGHVGGLRGGGLLVLLGIVQGDLRPGRGVVGAGQVAQRVDGLVLVPHLKVTVGSGGTARRANGRDGLALGDAVAHVDQELGAMGVVSQKAIGVGEDHQVAIGPLHPGKDDRAVCRRVDGGPGRSRDVDASVEVILPKDVAVAKVRGDGAADGP